MGGHVFISYSRADKSYVERLASYLYEAGISVWYDYDLVVGGRFTKEIQDQIATCAVLLAVLTPDSAASEWVDREIGCATELGKPILPVLLKVVKAGETPILLQNVHREDVTGDRMPSPLFVERLRQLTGIVVASARTIAPASVDARPESRPGSEGVAAAEPFPQRPTTATIRMLPRPQHLVRVENGEQSEIMAMGFAFSERCLVLVTGNYSSQMYVAAASSPLHGAEKVRRMSLASARWLVTTVDIRSGAQHSEYSFSGIVSAAVVVDYPPSVAVSAWEKFDDGNQVARTVGIRIADGSETILADRGARISIGPGDRKITALFSGTPNSREALLIDVGNWGSIASDLARRFGTWQSKRISMDGRVLADKDGERTVRIVSTQDGRELSRRMHPGTVLDLAVRPDGREVATACTDGYCRVLDPTTGRDVATYCLEDRTWLKRQAVAVTGVEYNRDGTALIATSDGSSSRDGRYPTDKLSDPSRRPLCGIFSASPLRHVATQRMTGAQFSANGEILVGMDCDRRPTIVNVRSGRTMMTLPPVEERSWRNPFAHVVYLPEPPLRLPGLTALSSSGRFFACEATNSAIDIYQVAE